MADRLEQVKAWLNEYDPHDRLEHVDWLIAELEQARQRIAELESLDYERIIQQPLRARIAELEAALEGDAGNVIHFAENAALDWAADVVMCHGHYFSTARDRDAVAAAILKRKEQV
jgi:hypothetical protein